MITLSTEKGLTKVDDWESIVGRAGFLASLNPADHELKSILGRYVFQDKVPCGLSNCKTPHNRGYIVATKDGRETNIGKDCGKHYFGVDFEVMANKFERDITEQDNRELLWNFSFNLDEVEARIASLRTGKKGADWVNKHSRPLVNMGAGVPQEIVRRMAALAKARSNVLSITREATSQEIENLEALQGKKIPRPHYVDEPIAEIQGIEALYIENDLRTLLILNLVEKIKAFKEKEIDQLSYAELASWKKWAVSVESMLEVANSVVMSGQQLLNVDNLNPLLKVLDTGRNRDQFREYLDGISI